MEVGKAAWEAIGLDLTGGLEGADQCLFSMRFLPDLALMQLIKLVVGVAAVQKPAFLKRKRSSGAADFLLCSHSGSKLGQLGARRAESTGPCPDGTATSWQCFVSLPEPKK